MSNFNGSCHSRVWFSCFSDWLLLRFGSSNRGVHVHGGGSLSFDVAKLVFFSPARRRLGTLAIVQLWLGEILVWIFGIEFLEVRNDYLVHFLT